MINKTHRPTPWIHRWFRPLMGAIATTGAVTTAYLTAEKLMNQQVACPIKGCEQVLSSPYATVLGVPLSLWGFLAYTTMAVLALLPLLIRPTGKRRERDNLEHWTALLLFAGATAMTIFSGYLMYLLAFQLHDLCVYCIVSASFSFSLFVLAVLGRDWLDRGQLLFIGLLVAIVTLISTLVIYSPLTSASKPPEIDKSVSTSILNSLKQVSQQALTSQPNSAKVILQPIPPAARLPGALGKLPEVVYVGADYCPFCASVRWSVTLALLRFGDFDGLKYMRSSSKDSFPDTPTLSFYQSKYQSRYLTFTPVELQDREGNALQDPTPEQNNILDKFNVAPYTLSPKAIPFLYIGGQYVQSGAPVSPGILQGLDWEQVTKQLQKSDSQIAQPILSNANLLTAAFCQLTAQAPSNVCKAPGVVAAASSLPR